MRRHVPATPKPMSFGRQRRGRRCRVRRWCRAGTSAGARRLNFAPRCRADAPQAVRRRRIAGGPAELAVLRFAAEHPPTPHPWRVPDRMHLPHERVTGPHRGLRHADLKLWSMWSECAVGTGDHGGGGDAPFPALPTETSADARRPHQANQRPAHQAKRARPSTRTRFAW